MDGSRQRRGRSDAGAGRQGARRTLVVIAAGAVALVLGLFVTTRAARAMATVSEMRSDFVSTVTHELKTPVQVIRSSARHCRGDGVRRREAAGVRAAAGAGRPSSVAADRQPSGLLARHRCRPAVFFEPQLPMQSSPKRSAGFIGSLLMAS